MFSLVFPICSFFRSCSYYFLFSLFSFIFNYKPAMGPLSSGFSKFGGEKTKKGKILHLISFSLVVVLFRFFFCYLFSAATGLFVFVFLCPFIFLFPFREPCFFVRFPFLGHILLIELCFFLLFGLLKFLMFLFPFLMTCVFWMYLFPNNIVLMVSNVSLLSASQQ